MTQEPHAHLSRLSLPTWGPAEPLHGDSWGWSPDSSTRGAKGWQTQPRHELCCQGTLCNTLWSLPDTVQRRHQCWFKNTLDCSCGNQGQYFGQASHLACSNTSFQATTTGYSHRQDLGLGGPSTAELIAAKEHCKRRDTSTQIKFFRCYTGNNLACRTLATRVESHAATSRSACLTELLSWTVILIKSLSGHSLKYSVQRKNYFQVKAVKIIFKPIAFWPEASRQNSIYIYRSDYLLIIHTSICLKGALFIYTFLGKKSPKQTPSLSMTITDINSTHLCIT